MRSKPSVKLATRSIIKLGVISFCAIRRGGRLTVPNHRELAKGTLRALIREAGLTKEQFAELL
jgi:HicA toxin of bacterial toxin-antitoxin,